MCVGIISWGEIKSGLILRGEGVRLPLHNAIWRQSWARSKSGLAFLQTFFNIKLLKNYTFYSNEKIMKDSEDPSAKIGIYKKNYDNYDFLE
jgi:hypothetical protein